MNTFYEDTDIFVSPSIKPESFGLVILEAMMHGIPVVATNHGGPTEIIKNNETGYLIDITSEELADKLIKLIEDKELRIELADNGYKDVKEKFSLAKMISELESVFDKYC